MATGSEAGSVLYLCSPAAVNEGANWPIGAGATGVQVCAVPWLNQTDEVGTLALVCGHTQKEKERGFLKRSAHSSFTLYTPQ